MLGFIGVADTIKPDAAATVDMLKAMHVRPYLLTGDQKEAAAAIARQAGIADIMAEVLPADKASHVQSLQALGGVVAMVGDGINDAPALKQADVGLAIGTGTDIAIETADVILSGQGLVNVPMAIRLSRAVIRNIKQNLFWAFFYNVVGIPVAAGLLYPLFGITLSPMLAAAAMSLSSVSVVSNALRLKRFKPDAVPAAQNLPHTGSDAGNEGGKSMNSNDDANRGHELRPLQGGRGKGAAGRKRRCGSGSQPRAENRGSHRGTYRDRRHAHAGRGGCRVYRKVRFLTHLRRFLLNMI